ncbi:MAG TPA: GNAT family N-acetyltransferase [Methylomirabilota bacterium]|nr:GNAT family N-acetyltransferase [Methylomirabilota bacterium]
MADAAAIRQARLDEAAKVLALWQEADATPSPTDTRDEVIKLLGEASAVLLVAEADGRLVGTVIGGWDGWRGNIYRLAVLPAYRRRGIARALVGEAARRLHGMGARRISALVESDHPWATDFWDSLGASGYRHDERMRRYVKTL